MSKSPNSAAHSGLQRIFKNFKRTLIYISYRVHTAVVINWIKIKDKEILEFLFVLAYFNSLYVK